MPADFFTDPETDPRFAVTDPPRGERPVLEQYLRHYRLTFEAKLQGLDAEQLARRAVPPSSLSLLGLLRHAAKMEHAWNRIFLQGTGEPRLYGCDDVRDADFDGAVADPGVVAEAWTAWRRERDAAEAYLATVPLDDVVDVRGDLTEVRDIAVHVIEEYARHCGHADLLRECVDGRVGQ